MVPPPMTRRPSRRARARRHRLRRWTTALLVGLAAFAAVSALAPSRSGAAGQLTLVATRDLPAGTTVSRADVRLAPHPADVRPRTALGAVEPAVGRVTAVPIPAGDTVTPERLTGSGLLAGLPADQVAIPLPVATVEGLGLGAGERVDVYAVGSGARVASDVLVLAVSAQPTDSLAHRGGTTVTVAVPPEGAAAVAASLSGLDSGGVFILALRRS